MDAILQLHEFFVEGGNQSDSHVLLHITEPSTEEEKNKGYFFAVCEINNAEPKHIARLQELIDRVENNYYELSETDDHSALEAALEQINSTGGVGSYGANTKISCIIGAVRSPDIIFSYAGQPHLILFYKNKQGAYEQMNLLETENDSTNEERSQLFKDLIQGKISSGDFLVAATPHVTDYFSHDRLQKIITSRPPDQSSAHLERVLTDLKSQISFGGLIITTTPREAPISAKTPPFQSGSSRHSLSNLFSTEKNTATTLAPSLWGQLKGQLKPAAAFLNKPQEITPPRPRGSSPAKISATHIYPHRSPESTAGGPLRDKIILAGSLLWRALKTSAKALWWLCLTLLSLLEAVGQNLLSVWYLISNHRGRRRLVLDEWKRRWRRYKEYFFRLPLSTKLIVLLSVCVIIAFIASLIYLKRSEIKQKRSFETATALKTIKTKHDAAESALVYNNYAEAIRLLSESRDLFKTISCQKNDQKTCDDTAKRTEELLAKARRLIIIKPELIASGDAVFTGLFKLNGQLITYSTSTNQLLSYDLLTKRSGSMPPPGTARGFSAASTPKENDFSILLFNDRELVRLDPVNWNFVNVDVGYPNDSPIIKSAVVYNRRLYSLDTINNQIYKHDLIKTGFGEGKEWLKKDAGPDLQDGVDMTVDGDVFVLKNNGSVLKLNSGLLQPFSLSGLDPALNNGGKIWTYNDVTYLYILDPVNKRLLVINKDDGTLEKQITAAEFVSPTGMMIDEPNNLAYILDNGKLYRINLK